MPEEQTNQVDRLIRDWSKMKNIFALLAIALFLLVLLVKFGAVSSFRFQSETSWRDAGVQHQSADIVAQMRQVAIDLDSTNRLSFSGGSVASDRNLYATAFLSNQRMYVAVGQDRIDYSKDAGGTWWSGEIHGDSELKSFGVLNDIFVSTDSSLMFAWGAARGELWRSTNGMVWWGIKLPARHPVKAVIPGRTENEFIALSRKGTIFVSQDRGVTWTRSSIASSPVGLEDLRAGVRLPDGRTTLVVGENGLVATSDERSGIWIESARIADQTITSLTLARGLLVATAVTERGEAQGSLHISRDFGENWSKRFTFSAEPMDVIVTPTTMVAVRSSREVSYSLNGWDWFPAKIELSGGTREFTAGPILLRSVTAISDELLIAVGDDGLVLVSTDAGVSWRGVELELPSRDLYSVTVDPKGGGIVIVGERGLVISSNQMADIALRELIRELDFQRMLNEPRYENLEHLFARLQVLADGSLSKTPEHITRRIESIQKLMQELFVKIELRHQRTSATMRDDERSQELLAFLIPALLLCVLMVFLCLLRIEFYRVVLFIDDTEGESAAKSLLLATAPSNRWQLGGVLSTLAALLSRGRRKPTDSTER